MSFEEKDSSNKKMGVQDKIVHEMQGCGSRKQEVDFNNSDIPEKNNIMTENEQYIYKQFKNNILNNIKEQLNSRKKLDKSVQNNLFEAINNLQENYKSLEKNVEQLEEVFNATILCLDETDSLLNKNICSLLELQQSFIKKFNNPQDESKISQIEKELDQVMKRVKEDLIAVTNKKDFTRLLSLLQAMQKMY